MRKLWLTFTAMLLCSISAFAQIAPVQPNEGNGTEASPYLISNASEFVWIANNNNYGVYFKQDDDINFGNLGELTAAIIPNFKGIYDGDGHTITYQANFNGAQRDGKYGLFGSVDGGRKRVNGSNVYYDAVIRNLNVNANVTLVGNAVNMNVALLCGKLGIRGVIEYCNVSGDINSAVNSSNGGGTDAGLVAGQCYGSISYCIVSGNVTGIGYVGGIVGQLGDVWETENAGSITACSFTGAVNADNTVAHETGREGSFGGGICGMSSNNSTIEFCVANADITAIKACNGISSTTVYSQTGSGWSQETINVGTTEVTNSYAGGNINGTPVNGSTITNSNGPTTPLYYEGQILSGGQEYDPYAIVELLNNAIPEEEQDKFYFDVINGEVVLIIGQRAEEEEEEEIVYIYYRTKTSNAAFNIHTTWQASVDGNDWVDNIAPQQNTTAYITISTGHVINVEHNLVITDSYKIIENNGVLKITQQGQLINTTGTNVPGIVEIVTPQKSLQAWTFVGAPFQTGYKLGCILPESHDVSVKQYDYEKTTNGTATPGWSDSWAHIGTPMKAGEGYFAYPFYNGVIDFTTYGDVGTYEDRGNIGYTSTNTVTALNNDIVTVTETIAQSNNGYWMALSNPYPAKLHVNAFKGANNLQGNCVYVFREGSFDMPATDIDMTEGFFVNVGSAGEKTITFNKDQLSYNNQNSAKASANEFIKLTLINGDKKVRAYLAHNENAEQGYDIFDANKLFAPTEIAEPYFVTDGIELIKEEFAELPYYATMNVRSFANDTVSFVVNNIPEGLAVSIIDGENVIDMVEGGVYTTEILTGENADRFKVLIKKNLGIADVEELEVNITNNNRHISIETTETDLQVEVYNALGQKVLSTKDRNFTLNQVSAGAYLIKAFNNKASKTQKIVVE